MIRLLVGLGNPGPEYDATRHNAGFWWLEEVAQRLRVQLNHDRAYHGLVARANTPHGAVWLLAPQTYMNLSGKAVAALARFYKIAPPEVLVVHDELDLLPGQIRMKQGGGHAGHNGLKDIQAQLGSPDFWRIRLGIGHPGVRSDVAAYVLRKPPAAEREAIEACIDKSMEALDALLAGDLQAAMRRLNARPPAPRPAPAGPGNGSGDDLATGRGPASGKADLIER